MRIYILDRTEKNKKSNGKLVLLLKNNVRKLSLTITLHFFFYNYKKGITFYNLFSPVLLATKTSWLISIMNSIYWSLNKKMIST